MLCRSSVDFSLGNTSLTKSSWTTRGVKRDCKSSASQLDVITYFLILAQTAIIESPNIVQAYCLTLGWAEEIKKSFLKVYYNWFSGVTPRQCLELMYKFHVQFMGNASSLWMNAGLVIVKQIETKVQIVHFYSGKSLSKGRFCLCCGFLKKWILDVIMCNVLVWMSTNLHVSGRGEGSLSNVIKSIVRQVVNHLSLFYCLWCLDVVFALMFDYICMLLQILLLTAFMFNETICLSKCFMLQYLFINNNIK